MSRVIRIVERAQSDVDSTIRWLARRSVRGAVNWHIAFLRAIQAIAETPAVAAIQEALDDMAGGDRGMLFEEFDKDFQQRHYYECKLMRLG